MPPSSSSADPPRAVAAVILAAGAARRFGAPKQEARVGEGTMLEAVVAVARSAGLAPILAVVPPGLAPPSGVAAVENDDPARGLSRSIQLGLRAVPAHVGAAVLMLGDQPTLPPRTIRALLEARGPRPIVAAAAGGLLAPPVLVERAAFALADALHGDVGLRDLLRADPGRVTAVPVPAHPPDVDTPADLERLRA